MLEFDLQKMTRHLVDVLDRDREIITVGEDSTLAFRTVEYGEPTVILEWPYLSVVPINKDRELKATRKYGIKFDIHLILYHGEVAKTNQIQEETHKRAEAIERFMESDRKWNFMEGEPADKDKVIHGQVSALDHPLVFLGGESLWRSSRLQLEAISEEYF